MSRIGIKPINIPESVNVDVKDSTILVTGKLGSLKFNFDKRVNVKLDSNAVTISREKNNRLDRELHGLTRALVNNMVLGVSEGFKKELKLNGVGYTAEQKMGKFLQLNLGFSHPIIVEIPNDLKVETTSPTTIVVSGINKQYVGQFAAKVRSFRKPDPYKGKGIKYSDEVIRRKAGKAIWVGG